MLEDDLVPLYLLNDALSTIKKKEDEQLLKVKSFIQVCTNEINSKIQSLGLDAPKIKKIVAENVLPSYINTFFEQEHRQLVLNTFINERLHSFFIKSEP